METPRRAISRRAERQHGLVTRADLREIGFTPGRLRSLLRHGDLEPVGTQTFAIGGAPDSAHRRVLAACLDTGGVASHGTAAWLHGIDGFGPGDPPVVVVRRARYDYRSTAAVVHTSTWLPGDDVTEVRHVPTLSLARTLFSLASDVPITDVSRVQDAIDVAVRDGKASDAWLWWSLERTRRRGRNGVGVFEQLLTVRAGGAVTQSWLEREFLRLLVEHGIELPVCQRRIRRQGAFVARVDFAYADLQIVIEVTGYTSHSTRRQQADDARRRNRLALAGFRVLEFTYDQVVGDPQGVVLAVVDALSARRRAAA